MKIFRTERTKIKEECWNLDYELIKWLNEHLKVYLEDSSKFVDLDYFKYEYNGKTYTFREIIEMLIEETNFLLNSPVYFVYKEQDNKSYEKEFELAKKTIEQMYDKLKLVHFHLWW